ncbi:hypothetical protein CHLRE_16g651650v5 [Chlamydomonas reinhardtii]|uniref:Aminoacyl-tRNA synthetase class Ia domain-containing protein n=1 Tax=Chlamydomonas reinhardtii TaxID=3055 RepID=A0A2K3CSW2_CHLRE|nr:uncharacterized protein CHLRE_16g651650v5 [Chlamydomonas reinhardtii]PNW71375.1 hypothetical protein CHLRE_16g651650v5 [Chlamydomonas reinhardtii]
MSIADVLEGNDYSFPKEEKKILELWDRLDAFNEQLKRTEGKPEYIFYDGPPFATGLPHYGHILAGTLKDIVTRYASATGHHVTRRFGWDCHGLPVEYEIDKKLSCVRARLCPGVTLTNVDYLTSVGLKQDEICNMASISVVLLGLNPETRLKSVVDYLKRRGVPDSGIPDLVLKHPRIFEYKLSADGSELVKGRARIQVDVVPVGANGEQACAVNYFREGASFMEAPVSPVGPVRAP